MRPRRCAFDRVFSGAHASRSRVRLRPVSRRPVCGRRRIAPRLTSVDRSLRRPFPHRRFAYRVRGALRPVSRRPVCGSRRIAPRLTSVDRSLRRLFPHQRFAYRVRGASPQAGPLLRRPRSSSDSPRRRLLSLLRYSAAQKEGNHSFRVHRSGCAAPANPTYSTSPSPAMVVRCMIRFFVAGIVVARCSAQRLSHMTRSWRRHLCE